MCCFPNDFQGGPRTIAMRRELLDSGNQLEFEISVALSTLFGSRSIFFLPFIHFPKRGTALSTKVN